MRSFAVTAFIRAATPARITLGMVVIVTELRGEKRIISEPIQGDVTLVGGCAIDTGGEGALQRYLRLLPESDAWSLRAQIREACIRTCLPVPQLPVINPR